MQRAWIIAGLAASLAVVATVPATAQMMEESTTTVSESTMVEETAPLLQRFQVIVGGQEVALTNEPVSVGAEILVPLRDSLTALGAQNIQVIPGTQQVSFLHQGRTVVMDLRTRTAMVDGTQMAIPGPVQMIEGHYFVPAQFISSLDPQFEVLRVRVAGFRGTPGFPEGSGIQSFSIGGQSFTYNRPTWFMGRYLMVPLEETLTAMGAQFTPYEPGELQVPFTYNGQNVLLNIGSGYAFVGPQAFPMGAVTVNRDGVVFVPATFFQTLVPGFSISQATR